MTIPEYINQVRLQFQNNSSYKKYTKFTIFPKSPYSENQILNKILNESYLYLSVVKINKVLHWEFYNKNKSDNFINFKFLYVKVSEDNFHILKQKLPYYYSFDLETTKVEYPNKNYLVEINSNVLKTYYDVPLVDLYSHPFLPTFYFIGKVYLIKSKLFYEYVDNEGIYSVKGFTYLSTLRPTNLYYPLGEALESQIEIDSCFNDEQIKYPSKGNTNFNGEYTGRYTSFRYSKYIKFWEYFNEDYGTFFLEEAPSSINIGRENALRLINKPLIQFLTNSSTTSISIKQTSTPIQINL